MKHDGNALLTFFRLSVSLSCGGTSSENCTYFDSSSLSVGSNQAGSCSARICPCGSDICQVGRTVQLLDEIYEVNADVVAVEVRL